MSLKVRYYDAPDGAQEAAYVITAAGQPFSGNDIVVTGGTDLLYATLEPGNWPLDGSRQIMSDSPEGFWWSAQRSDADGNFAVPIPSINIRFPSPYTATGLTFTFSPSLNQWCTQMRIRWYNGSEMLDITMAYPDSPRWTLKRSVESFDRILIELYSTNLPGQFARIQQIEIGQTHLFDRGELVAVQLMNEVDPTLCNLTVDTMKVTIRDRMQRNLIPQENQRMELYRDDALMAVQFIEESSREAQHSFSFSCQSVIGLLEDDYLGGLYDAEPVEDLLTDILDGRKFTLDEVFAGKTITGYLPICTRREALQQLAFVLDAVVTSHKGIVELRPLPQEISGEFSPDKIFPGTKVESSQRVARVEVTAHSYVPSGEEEVLADNVEVRSANYLFAFDEPHYDYTITGDILESMTKTGANYVSLTANGTVTITGKKYIHSKASLAKSNPAATAAERSNVITVDSATLIHSGNVEEVLNNLYNAVQQRQTLTQEVVVSGHQVGQLVTSDNPWGTKTQGYISSMDSTLTQGGHTAMVTIIGTEVQT